MNKRIEELMTKASKIRYSGFGDTEILNPEKFAELIVKECISLAENVANDNKNSDSERMGAEYVITNLIEHFGVK